MEVVTLGQYLSTAKYYHILHDLLRNDKVDKDQDLVYQHVANAEFRGLSSYEGGILILQKANYSI